MYPQGTYEKTQCKSGHCLVRLGAFLKAEGAVVGLPVFQNQQLHYWDDGDFVKVMGH